MSQYGLDRSKIRPGHRARALFRRLHRRSREEWPVLIRDHHPGYISFEKYLENQERIRDNEVIKKALRRAR